MFTRLVIVFTVLMLVSAVHGFRFTGRTGSAIRKIRGGALGMSTTATPAASIPKVKGSSAEKMLEGVDSLIFDLDGVIFLGDSVIPGVPETLDKLRALGKKMFFVTNNSTKSRAGYLKKFLSLGLTVEAEEIFSSSFAAAAYFEQNPLNPGEKVYVIGQVGVGEELDLMNVPWIGGQHDVDKTIDLGPGVKVDIDKDVKAVVVGFDSKINYYKLQYAQLAINENGAKFIATNCDAVTNLTDAQKWAGNGAMVGAIKGCTGQEPIVVGKPAPLMIDYISNKYKMDRSRILMVGDRLDTDMLFGKDNGLQTVLTLSGVTTEEKLLSPENKIIPDQYVSSIADFFE